MIEAKENPASLEDIHALVNEINELTVTGGVVDLLSSDPVLLEQITIVNLCVEQLEAGDDLLMDELQSIVARLREAAQS